LVAGNICIPNPATGITAFKLAILISTHIVINLRYPPDYRFS
jgi:hypothetical protein